VPEGAVPPSLPYTCVRALVCAYLLTHLEQVVLLVMVLHPEHSRFGHLVYWSVDIY
jgi:hypothetical protein